MLNTDELVTVGYRGWTNQRKSYGSGLTKGMPTRLLILDTETTTSVTQAFRFGFARLTRLKPHKTKIYTGITEREVLVISDNLKDREPAVFRTVMQYAKKNKILTVSQRQFANGYLMNICYKHSLSTSLVGLNLSFDLSRIAYGTGYSKSFKEGFTFRMFPKESACSSGCNKAHANHRILCKMMLVDFDKDGNPMYLCESLVNAALDGTNVEGHDCKLPPCDPDCKQSHHKSDCFRACKEKHKHEYGCRFKCEKKHSHIPPYCPADCQDHKPVKNCPPGCGGEDCTDHLIWNKCRKPPCPMPVKSKCHEEHEHHREPYFSDHFPTIRIKHVDSKRAFIQWGNPEKSDEKKMTNGGRFIDLRQLIFGMTNRGVSLASAGELFELDKELRKHQIDDYDVIDEEFIDYARQDVRTTEALAIKVLAEYKERHFDATGLPPEKVYSPAKIGKAYFDGMGITPMLDRGEFHAPQDNQTLGYCMSTFYGARAEVPGRKIPLPVTICDFVNMYGTVSVLMKLWNYHTAFGITIDDSDKELSRITELATRAASEGANALLNPEIWPSLVGFARIKPHGDILPTRAKFASSRITVDPMSGKEESNGSFNVGMPYFYSERVVWYAYADILASAMLTGKVPEITEVMKFNASTEKMPGLKPITFGGVVTVDPVKGDLFKALIEHRATIKKQMKKEGFQVSHYKDQETIKIVVNATDYGMFAEMQPDEGKKDKKTDEITETEDTQNTLEYKVPDGEIVIFGQWGSWKCKPSIIEVPGQFCYPPIGAVITAAARLMLSILEKLMADMGGEYAFGDTDSMALVTTRNGGLMPCPGGPYEMPDGREAIKTLSREEIISVRATMNRLNPFDRDKVEEILKDETEEPNKTGQVYAYGVSSKRYCLFTYDKETGRPVIPPDFYENGKFKLAATVDGKRDGKTAYMIHGLGQYLNPENPESEDAPKELKNDSWERQIWQYWLDRDHGLEPILPSWVDSPALAKYAVTTPMLHKSFQGWNEGKEYDDQIKPFNFILMATEIKTVDQWLGAEGFLGRRLLAPYSSNVNDWFNFDWYDINNPTANPVKITTTEEDGKAHVKSHRTVVEQYGIHPEMKFAMPDGRPCNLSYSGMLRRRVIRPTTVETLGKEANKLDEIEAGLVLQNDVIVLYPRKDRSEVQRAFGNRSNRAIARLVNHESEQLIASEAREFNQDIAVYGRELFLDTPKVQWVFGYYGYPVQIDEKVIARYFAGTRVTVKYEVAIIRTAAKLVASRIGVDPKIINYRKGQPTYIACSPGLVLSMWREEGYPDGEIEEWEKAIVKVEKKSRPTRKIDWSGLTIVTEEIVQDH